MPRILKNIIEKITNKKKKVIDDIILNYIKQHNMRLVLLIGSTTLIVKDHNVIKEINQINKTFNINFLKRFKIKKIVDYDNTIKATTNNKYQISKISFNESDKVSKVEIKYNNKNQIIEYNNLSRNYEFNFLYFENLLMLVEKNCRGRKLKSIMYKGNQFDGVRLSIIKHIVDNQIWLPTELVDDYYLGRYDKQNNVLNTYE